MGPIVGSLQIKSVTYTQVGPIVTKHVSAKPAFLRRQATKLYIKAEW